MRDITDYFQAQADGAEDEGCRFIVGDPETVWSYCCDPKKRGSSYCSHHHSICYLNEEQTDYELRKITILARSKVGAETAHIIMGH